MLTYAGSLCLIEHDAIDRDQKRRQRFARPRRRQQQRIVAFGNQRPRFGLDRGWRRERLQKPATERGVKERELDVGR